ncbi:hypothetical protein BDV95DRAFT_93043 [Massariosphaeria phaeospora]|uniref:Uncharacterized protein n=1 Tax=Massariosphaeria phaeospora TaxID=100035 RepID=A0A7C8I7B6_9PLEO|nr:hypothetical protein BDV95DRAFT_93043 [Massariosphaeria phaeospora]
MAPQLLNYITISTLSTTIPATTPIYMLNLLRFRPTAVYGPDAPPAISSLPPVSGYAAYYTRYLPTVMPLMPAGAAPVFVGKPLANLVASAALVGDKQADGEFGQHESEGEGEGEGVAGVEWDAVAIVRYESFGDFKTMATSDVYRETAMPHRVAAVEAYKLVVCEELKM